MTFALTGKPVSSLSGKLNSLTLYLAVLLTLKSSASECRSTGDHSKKDPASWKTGLMNGFSCPIILFVVRSVVVVRL